MLQIIAYNIIVVSHCRKPTAQMVHLVFADTQNQHKKPKELEFCQRSIKTTS